MGRGEGSKISSDSELVSSGEIAEETATALVDASFLTPASKGGGGGYAGNSGLAWMRLDEEEASGVMARETTAGGAKAAVYLTPGAAAAAAADDAAGVVATGEGADFGALVAALKEVFAEASAALPAANACLDPFDC